MRNYIVNVTYIFNLMQFTCFCFITSTIYACNKFMLYSHCFSSNDLKKLNVEVKVIDSPSFWNQCPRAKVWRNSHISFRGRFVDGFWQVCSKVRILLVFLMVYRIATLYRCITWFTLPIIFRHLGVRFLW